MLSVRLPGSSFCECLYASLGPGRGTQPQLGTHSPGKTHPHLYLIATTQLALHDVQETVTTYPMFRTQSAASRAETPTFLSLSGLLVPYLLIRRHIYQASNMVLFSYVVCCRVVW